MSQQLARRKLMWALSTLLAADAKTLILPPLSEHNRDMPGPAADRLVANDPNPDIGRIAIP